MRFLSSLMKEYALRDLEKINGLNKKLEKSLREKTSEDLAKIEFITFMSTSLIF